MKTLLAILFTLTVILAHPQVPPAPVVKAVFNYDASGNRITRHIEIPTWLIKKPVKGVDGSLRSDSLLILSMDSLAKTPEAIAIKKDAMHSASAYGICVYPNPSSGIVKFSANKITAGQLLQLAVYDNNGKRICLNQHQGSEAIIDLTTYAEGTYHIMVLLPGEERLHYKIVKVK